MLKKNNFTTKTQSFRSSIYIFLSMNIINIIILSTIKSSCNYNSTIRLTLSRCITYSVLCLVS